MSEPEHEVMDSGELVYRASAPEDLHLREEVDTSPILEGRMMPYNEWTEVRSAVEGHFMERFAPSSLAKTMQERAHRIRVLVEHGLSTTYGKQPIAVIEEMRDEPDGGYYRSALLDGLSDLFVSGLRRGLYGSSIRFRPIKWDRQRSPQKSEHNPDGIPEHTIREAQIQEFSVVTFPQYAGATAMVRSLTDEVAAASLVADPARLLEILTARSEPQHSTELGEPDDQAQVQVASRSTRPTRSYLKPREETPSWRISKTDG